MPRATSCTNLIATIGIDIGKNTFHVIGLDDKGAIILRHKLTRGQVYARLANIPPCLIGMEACVGAHHPKIASNRGIKRAADLCALLRAVVASEFTRYSNLDSLGRSPRPMLEKSDYDRRGRGADAWLAYTVVGSNCLTLVLSITNSGTAR